MHHVLVALQAHRDLAKLDFEDGIARRFATDRLASPSSITQIRVDLRAEAQRSSHGAPTEAIDALLWMSAHDRADLDANRINEQLEPFAGHVAGWFVDSRIERPVEVEWPGTATPGVKIVVFLRRANGVPLPSFVDELDGLVAATADRMVSGGVARHLVTDELVRSPLLDAAVSLWFPTEARLEEASSLGIFTLFDGAPFLDSTEARRLVVFEQRLHPNPNLWFDGAATEVAAHG